MQVKNIFILIFFSWTFVQCSAQNYPNTPPEISPMEMKPEMTEIWNPEVRVVKPGNINSAAPSDAIILFDGSNMDQWVSQNDITKPSPWKIINKEHMEVVPGTGWIQTKMKFGDCQLHIEFSAPDKVESQGQGRGNSGVFFQNRYEIQILDSYQNRTYANGQAGSVYKDHPPLVNAMRGPLEWNTYDIVYKAPRFNPDGTIETPASMTAFHNGVLVQNNSVINGLTLYKGLHRYGDAHDEDVIALQDHDNKTQFRNIWLRRL